MSTLGSNLKLFSLLVALIVFCRLGTLCDWMGGTERKRVCVLVTHSSMYLLCLVFKINNLFIHPNHGAKVKDWQETKRRKTHWPNQLKEKDRHISMLLTREMQDVITPIFRIQTYLLPYYSFTEVNSHPVLVLITSENDYSSATANLLTDAANNVAGLMFLNWLHIVLTCCFRSCKCIKYWASFFFLNTWTNKK